MANPVLSDFVYQQTTISVPEGTTFDVPKPANLADTNDVVVAVMVSCNISQSPSAPDGFILEANNDDSTSTSQWRIFVFRKRISDAASEPANYAFINNSSASSSIRWIGCRAAGADNDNFLSVAHSQARGDNTVTSIDVPSITPSHDDCVLLLFGNAGGDRTWSPNPTGMSPTTSASTESVAAISYEQDLGVAGATGDKTLTISSTHDKGMQGLMIAITPTQTAVTDEIQMSHTVLKFPDAVKTEQDLVEYTEHSALTTQTNPLGNANHNAGIYLLADRQWFFFGSGGNLYYKTKQEARGGQWSESIQIFAGLSTPSSLAIYDEMGDTDYFHFAYVVSGSVKYRRAEPKISGEIVLGAEQSVWTAVDGWTADEFQNAITLVDGKPAISFRAGKTDPLTKPVLSVSSNTDGTWLEDFVIDLDTQHASATHGARNLLFALDTSTLLAAFHDDANSRVSAVEVDVASGTAGSLEDTGLEQTAGLLCGVMHGGKVMLRADTTHVVRDSGWTGINPGTIQSTSWGGFTIGRNNEVRTHWIENKSIWFYQSPDFGVTWGDAVALWKNLPVGSLYTAYLTTVPNAQRRYHTGLVHIGTGDNPKDVYGWIDEIGGVLPPVITSPALGSTEIDPIDLLLQWDDLEQDLLASLEIYVDEISGGNLVYSADNIIGTAHSVTLDYSQTYIWRVRLDGSAWATADFETKPPLPAPQLLAPEHQSTDIPVKVLLQWESAGYTSFKVQAYSSLVPLIIVVDTVVSVNEYSLEGLEYNSRYYWRVAGINESDEQSEFSALWQFDTIKSPVELDSPANASTSVGINTVLGWIGGTDNSKYDIQVATDIGMSNLILNVTGHTDKNYNVFNLSYNTTYYWRVREVIGDTPLDWTDIWSFVTETIDEAKTIDLQINQSTI